MKRLSLIAALALAAAISTSTFADPITPPQPSATVAQPASLQQAAHDAISQDAAKSAEAIRILRTAGQKGLDTLFIVNAPVITPANPGTQERAATLSAAELRLRAAADEVAMQKDAYASHLYWYTDLEKAKAAAAAARKPILSLRMLGKLNEDLSCANSRFFRTTLYANAEVSQFLRDNFILHWESVRPVPVITIDMGDGRKMVRTITGNSIHYVLDYNGRVVDGIPGLYGAKTFLQALSADLKTAKSAGLLNDAAFTAEIKSMQSQSLRAASDNWKADLAQIGAAIPAIAPVSIGRTKAPTAVAAAPIAVGKGRIEVPILVQIMPDGKALEAATSDELWSKIAALHTQEAAIDASVKNLILAKSPELAQAAMRAAVSKRAVESPLLRMVRNLQNSIALDTVRNEYLLHSRLREWLAQSDQPVALKPFNDRVYADLFLTPGSDPWLGLVPPDTYSALDNGGICTAPQNP
jgi:hypothetical protein